MTGTLKMWPGSIAPQTYAERMAFYFKQNSCGQESIHPFLCKGPPIVKSLWETLKVMQEESRSEEYLLTTETDKKEKSISEQSMPNLYVALYS